jgi:zinc protease
MSARVMSARVLGGSVLAALLASVLAAACATGGGEKVRSMSDVTKEQEAAKAARLAEAEKAAAAAKAAALPAIDPMIAGEALIQAQPALSPLADFAAPVPHSVTLPSGLTLLVVEKPGATVEALSYVVRRGSTADPEGLAGLASLSAAMLEAGSAGQTQAQMAARADALGATLRAGAGTDSTQVAITAVPSKFAQMVPLLADVVLKPNLEETEWKRLQGQRIAELQANLAEPRVQAGLAFASALYGAGPLGQPALGTPESVQKAGLADVKAFLGGFDPHEAAILAVGPIPAAEVAALVGKAFASLDPKPGKKGVKAGAKAPAKAPTPIAAPFGRPTGIAAWVSPRLLVVDFPGRPQTVVRVGQIGVPRSSPDTLALRVLNSVLGGSFTSRLNQNLREKNGYTYGIGSAFAFGRLAGPFGAQSSIKTEVTGVALVEVLKEITRAVEEPLAQEELEKGKALLAYQLVETLQRSEATAGAVAELFVDGLPMDELQTLVPRLRALTVADVQAAAKRALQPGKMTIVLAGDWKVVGPQLKAAGLDLPEAVMREVKK